MQDLGRLNPSNTMARFMIRFLQSCTMILITLIFFAAFMVLLVDVLTTGRQQASGTPAYFALAGLRL